MAIPRTLQTLEVQKFKETTGGLVAVRTCLVDSTINTQPQGLSIAGRITEVAITATGWTALPATPLVDRNAIAIQNVSGEEIKIQYFSGSTGGYVGIRLVDGAERFYGITEDIILYARSETSSVTIVIEELS